MLYFGCACFDADTLEGCISTGQPVHVTSYKNADTKKTLDAEKDLQELKETLVQLDEKDDYAMSTHFMSGHGGKMETMDIAFIRKTDEKLYFTLYLKFTTPAPTGPIFAAMRASRAKTEGKSAKRKRL